MGIADSESAICERHGILLDRETQFRERCSPDRACESCFQFAALRDGELFQQRRYNAVRERGDHAVFVAEEDGRIIGLLHLYERPAFDKPPEVVVQAIVVDQSLRGAGVGTTMMSMAERWALERGFSSIALTSNISGSGAHLFYDRLGYKIERHLIYSGSS